MDPETAGMSGNTRQPQTAISKAHSVTGDEGSCCTTFQRVVDDHLVRHRSVLDVLSKCQESASRVNRSVVKATTACGCVEVHATAQQYPMDGSLMDIRAAMHSHLQGELCEHCREIVEVELGRAFFYLTAVCNLFDLPLQEVLTGETKRVAALGVYNLT